MSPRYFVVLIEVHLRNVTYHKGQRLTLEEFGADAFTLIHYGLCRSSESLELAA